MAQSRVTQYYNSRKRNNDLQPSKRRKVQRTSYAQGETTEFSDSPITRPPDSDVSTATETLSAFSSSIKGSTNKRVTLSSDRAHKRRSTKKKAVGPIEKAFRRLRSSACETEYCSSSSDLDLRVSDTDSNSTTSETTANLDDHDATVGVRLSPPGTPTKRCKSMVDGPISRKRRKPASRLHSQNSFDYSEEAKTPAPAEFHFEFPGSDVRPVTELSKRVKKKASPPKEVVAKKKLELKESLSNNEGDGTQIQTEEVRSQRVSKSQSNITIDKGASSVKSSQEVIKAKTSSSPSAKADEIEVLQSPEPKQITHRKERLETTNKNKSPATCTPLIDKVKMAKLKEKLSPATVKERLSKVGSLTELQARLAKVKEHTDKNKTKKPPLKIEEPVVSAASATTTKESSKMPAYEKYHTLAAPVPPSLTLPYKYKILEEMFRSVDTIVSLLRNRSETCTFGKLKDAVQEMVRKTFDVKNLGQMKTVYPSAYVFRQEKGIPYSKNGLKSSDYQLTVDANLDSPTNESHKGENINSKSQKLTSSKLLERKGVFHRRLVDIVKHHHQNFLSSLPQPMTVPNDKITRWHPKFPVDQVPDIEPAPLPEPPNVKKYTSARDVLNKARDMLHPRVEKVLENVAAKSDKEAESKMKAVESVTPQGSVKKVNGMKGVPQSLLERIRAKEAEKIEACMMRDPAEDKKTVQMEKLPDLCRILRGFFLSEKKAALTMEAATKKLSESYKSSISIADVEDHIKLMSELLPEWLSIIHIRKTTYLKIDKNVDMNTVAAKINRMVKERK
ncbi:DNA replication factor Cdt1-like [Ptychodera flava]|uniref:DNA replication factor Cdt1-like n=1 Tax=Ptychodera flava TaxID=63121 RepID=UPI003969CF1C